ncbi:MepB family protein [Flavobacterium sp. JP2137]|uniref:MepB family protein n=1 Tax=Flavobacterium sp. JP2137 TaxID=3414510 RepID=UPI003D2F9E18
MSALPHAYTLSKQRIYDVLELMPSHPQVDCESAEYASCAFVLNRFRILFRSAKITPAKIGQFVTLWKRSSSGPIAPFESEDPFDLVVVCAADKAHFGQFIFPKSALLQQGILSDPQHAGKRAFRVYPPWDSPTSKQAQKTQAWQLPYFYDLSDEDSRAVHLDNIRKLFAFPL